MQNYELYGVFVTKLIFANLIKSPRKHQQGGNLEDSYSHEKFI